jgi:hypothetical protein
MLWLVQRLLDGSYLRAIIRPLGSQHSSERLALWHRPAYVPVLLFHYFCIFLSCPIVKCGLGVMHNFSFCIM